MLFTVCHKREHCTLVHYLHQILTDFKNSFTDRISRKFAIKRSLKVSLHLPRVGFGAQVCCHCRISPPRFLAECCKRRLNQGSFVVLYFNLSGLSDLYLVFVCLFSCTVFVFSYCMFIFLYCFVCQYQSSDWL